MASGNSIFLQMHDFGVGELGYDVFGGESSVALMCGLFCAHQAYAVQFVRTATHQWCTPRNQASVNWFGVGPGCLFVLERGQHFKFRRKFRVVFISVAQNSSQVFAAVIWNILADSPQANVPHATNARRIQHLQKCFGLLPLKPIVNIFGM